MGDGGNGGLLAESGVPDPDVLESVACAGGGGGLLITLAFGDAVLLLLFGLFAVCAGGDDCCRGGAELPVADEVREMVAPSSLAVRKMACVKREGGTCLCVWVCMYVCV